MALITPVTAYPAGPLNVAGHNANVHSATTGQGVMSECNGNLNAANLHSSFTTFEAEHCYPEAHLFGRQETIRLARQCFGDMFGGTLTTQDSVISNPDRLVGLPGGNLRIYLEQSSTVIWQWSYFVAPQRWVIYRDGGNGTVAERTGLAMTAAKLDGGLLTHTIRPLPLSLAVNEQAVPIAGDLAGLPVVSYANRRVFSYAGRTAVWRDLCHLSANLAAGWHDIQVVMYFENLQRTDPLGENLPTIFAAREEALASFTEGYAAYVTNAAVFGITTPRAFVAAA